ncbi:MAG: FAD-dependent oxidoreductase [Candidatus Aenigmarchaeota archaeon]|nr:FAD-dependent oxidoreductase [Candidatus Aenigmarchaeota archaeon]
MKTYDVIILGSGPAGLTAGIYASRYNMKNLVIGKEIGGQVAESYEIENYPGFLKVNGIELAEKFREHAERIGVELIPFINVLDIQKKRNGFVVKAENDMEYFGKCVIFATGARKRKLGIKGEDRLAGRGISYCAICDAPFFKNKIVGVIGGGDSAVSAAVLLAEHAKKVYLLYRREKGKMRATPYWVMKAEKNKKIEMVFNAVPKEFAGKDKLEYALFDCKGKELKLKLDGIFVEVGTKPESELAKKLGVRTDERGYIIVNHDMSTNVKGVFAAGDVTTGSNMFAQIITAASEGAIAAESSYKYIKQTSRA